MDSMKNTGFLCIVSSVILTGCVHTSQIGDGEFQAPWDSISELVAGKEVIAKGYDGTAIKGTAVKITSDTLWLYNRKTISTAPIPIRDVVSIETPGSSTGQIVGGLMGCVAGVGIGLMIGHANESGFMRGMESAIDASIGGVIGAVAGAVVGAQTTAGHRYVFPDSGRAEANPMKPEAILGTNAPTEYVNLVVKTSLEETETSITIPWAEGKVTLPKSEITVTHTKDGIDIRVPKWLWQSHE
jgi:hypothetical protein